MRHCFEPSLKTLEHGSREPSLIMWRVTLIEPSLVTFWAIALTMGLLIEPLLRIIGQLDIEPSLLAS